MDSQRTIGVRISPSGEQQTEYEHKLGQTRGFARGMSGSHLTKSEARKAYKTVYVPMIAYSLGVTTLPENKLNKLQLMAEEAYLPKIGMNRKFPKRVLRGPQEYGGMGDPSYYTIQGYKQLQLLIGHVRDNDEVGTMIRQEIELLQITAGVSKPIMHRESDSEWKHWVEPTWITAIKTFLTGINAGLHFTDEWLPACPRKGDAFIMDSVGKEVKEEIANQINRCRIFLHCITLTDIATPDGKYLDRNALYGRRNPAYESVLKWPKQQEIYKEGWTVWRTYLQETFCLPHSYELCTPLGDWEKGKGHLRWNLYQDIVTKYIYRRTPDTAKETWTRHRPTLDNELVLNSSDGTSYQPPRHAFCVSFKSSSPSTWILYDSNKQPMKVQPYHQRPSTDDTE